MIFLYSDEAGKERLKLRGEEHKYLAKVRRHKMGDTVSLRNPQDSKTLYRYTIEAISARDLILTLQSQEEEEVKPTRRLHLGWCMIDPKSIEKVLPSLNELGVGKISFIYCARSQKNFKPDFKRFNRILKASNQQCGRSDFMEFALFDTLKSFLATYPDVKVFDFCENVLRNESGFRDVLIGCEGGFSKEEKELLASKEVFRLDTPLVLRSESAACAVAAKILL